MHVRDRAGPGMSPRVSRNLLSTSESLRHYLKTSDYIRTDSGRLGRYNKRRLRRRFIQIRGIEPRSKKAMAAADQSEIQRRVLVYLESHRYRAYRGPVVIRLRIATTDRTPAHAPTIAKNILDLFSRPQPHLPTARKGLLYFDDRQIHGLAVSCEHGAPDPELVVDARPLADFRDDLELALHVLENRTTHYATELDADPDAGSLNLELITGDPSLRQRVGDETYEALVDIARQDAQRHFLGGSRLRPSHLAHLYRAGELRHTAFRTLLDDFAGLWERGLRTAPFRFRLSDLPQKAGTSDAYKAEVDAVLRRFRNRYGRLLVPLRTPVALEVVVKPPRPEGRRPAVHDLDNILRNYLIPKVVQFLQPPSDLAWTLRRPASTSTTDALPQPWREKLQRLPLSARIGLVRFEAWRIPRAKEDNSPGFVSAAVVADPFGYDDTLRRLDTLLHKWADSSR